VFVCVCVRVCVGVCMVVYICLWVCVFVFPSTYQSVCLSVWLTVRLYVSFHVSVHVVYAWLSLCGMLACLHCACAWVCIHACVHACVHVRLCACAQFVCVDEFDVLYVQEDHQSTSCLSALFHACGHLEKVCSSPLRASCIARNLTHQTNIYVIWTAALLNLGFSDSDSPAQHLAPSTIEPTMVSNPQVSSMKSTTKLCRFLIDDQQSTVILCGWIDIDRWYRPYSPVGESASTVDIDRDPSTGLINRWIVVDIWIGVETVSHHTWNYDFLVDVCPGPFLTTYGTIGQWFFFSTSRKNAVNRLFSSLYKSTSTVDFDRFFLKSTVDAISIVFSSR